MWPVKDLFYGEREPVWILKSEKKDDKKGGEASDQGDQGDGNKGGKKGNKKEEYTILDTIPFYPYYYPDYIPPTNNTKKADDSKDNKKEKKLVLKVPICCNGCEESVRNCLEQMKGVKSVECNIPREKVTVVLTTAAPADVILECRTLFKNSREWTNDD